MIERQVELGILRGKYGRNYVFYWSDKIVFSEYDFFFL